MSSIIPTDRHCGESGGLFISVGLRVPGCAEQLLSDLTLLCPAHTPDLAPLWGAGLCEPGIS